MDAKVIANFDKFIPLWEQKIKAVPSAVEKIMRLGMLEVEREAILNVSGRVLKAGRALPKGGGRFPEAAKGRGGHLRSNIFSDVHRTKDKTTGTVGTPVKYGMYWEKGIKATYPIKAKALRWFVEGKPVFAKYVKARPARPWLWPAWKAKEKAIMEHLNQTFREAGF